jgi:hypothetical protein
MLEISIKTLLKKNKVKITFGEDMRHYRYNIHCLNCGRFKEKNHKCELPPRKKYGRYKFSRCKKYLLYNAYQKDRTKRFGINTRCRKCRQETGNGNKTIRQSKIEWY